MYLKSTGENIMSNFENDLKALCKELGVTFVSSSSKQTPCKNSVFNSSLGKLGKIKHTPTTAIIDPLSLPFIR